MKLAKSSILKTYSSRAGLVYKHILDLAYSTFFFCVKSILMLVRQYFFKIFLLKQDRKMISTN